MSARKKVPWAHTQIDKEVWFVGHGIKHIGAKESFISVLQDPLGEDIPWR